MFCMFSFPLYGSNLHVCNRVWEKIMEKLQEVGQSTTGMKRRIARWAKGIGLQGNINIEKG